MRAMEMGVHIEEEEEEEEEEEGLVVGNDKDKSGRNVGGGGGCLDLRKSLAWHTAFFTEQGVLNPTELSRLCGKDDDFLLPQSQSQSQSQPHHYYHPNHKRLPTINSTTRDSKIPKFNHNHTTSQGYLTKHCIPPLPKNRITQPTPTLDAAATKVKSRTTKPSRLRMPSPSLQYFAQSEASTSLSVKSPQNIRSCNLLKVSVSRRGKSGDSCQIGVPSHEPASAKRMPHKGATPRKCPIPSGPTTTSHPSIKLKTKFKDVQASPLLSSKFEIYGAGRADMSNENQHAQEAIEFLKSHDVVGMDDRKAASSEVSQSVRPKKHFTHEAEKPQHEEDHIPQVNNGRLVEQSSPADSMGDNYVGKSNKSKNNNSSKLTEITRLAHNNNSDGELNYELEKASQRDSNWKLQKGAELENLNAPVENEEFNSSELKILQVPPLMNPEMQNNGVSGEDHLIEHMNDEALPLQESLRSIPLVDTDKRMLAVDNDCIEAGNDGSTLLAEQEHLKKLVRDVVDNVRHEEKHCPPKDHCGPTEQDNTFSKSLENIHPVNLRCKGLKNYISPKHSKTSGLSHCKISGAEKKCEFENSELPPEDTGATIAVIQKSLGSSSQDSLMSKHKLNPAPFSDEWLAALEEVGEEILTKKTGAVQNSPPDKSLPEPGPWSPVKRKNVAEIGPFDCTKYTNQLGAQLE